MSLPQRTIGQGLTAASIGLGCMSLTPGFYGSEGISEEEGIAVIRRALELGANLFNTSDLYGPLINEKLVGKALKDVDRNKVVITTKWGPYFQDGQLVHDYSAAYARKAAESALERLQTNYIDLFTLRGPIPPETNLEETMNELKALVNEGKVKYIGLSEVSPEDVRRAHSIVPIAALEQEWSLFTRDLEKDLLPVCQELGIGILAYSPLGRGLLTGQLKSHDQLQAGDFRAVAYPRFQGENWEKNRKLVENLEALAAKKGVTAGQLAMAWLLAKAPDAILIPGTKRIKYLEENMGAANIKLTHEEVAEIEGAVPEDAVAGNRYANMKATYKSS